MLLRGIIIVNKRKRGEFYMINESFKEKFINDKSTITKGYVKNVFNKCAKLEELYNKDVCNFTLEQIKEVLLTFCSTSVECLRVVTSVLRKYTYFMIENNLSKDNINHYDYVDTEILMKCVNIKVLDNKYIDRETLLGYIDILPNASDQWCILALYEGISGEKLSNITLTSGNGLQYSDEKIKLFDGSIFTPSSKLFDIACESAETYVYEGINVCSDKLMRLQGDKILKIRDNVMIDDNDIHRAYNRLLARIRTSKNYLDVKTMSIPRLQLSGMVYQFKCIMEKENKTYDELFDSEEFYNIRKKFGYEKYVKSRLYAIIKDYM